MNSLQLIFSKCVCCFMFFFACTDSLSAQNRETTLHNLNNLLINTVMTDLFTPPVASRIYAYPNIAFYECIRLEDPTMATLSGKLNGLVNLPAPQANIKTDFFIAACVSYCYVAQSLVGTEYKISDWRLSFIDSLLLISDKSLVNTSIDYGRRVADSIISWISRDNYLKSRGYSRFVLSNDPGSWQPTPLDYAPAIEPYWKTIRPMAMKSASQFSPKEKLVFSKSKKLKIL